MLNDTSTKKLVVDEKVLNKTVQSVHDTILNKLFGSEYVNVKTLLQTVSNLAGDSYELELRIIDENNAHTSKKSWFIIPESELTLQSYSDDVLYSYAPVIPISNIKFRSYEKSGLFERKIMINSISSRSESATTIPLNIKLSKETMIHPITEECSLINIQRKQRASYKFNDPELADWRVDKTIRFITHSMTDKKITLPLDVENVNSLKYYDYLDLEIEYVGDFHDLFNSFFKLVEKICPSFTDFNINYNIIKTILTINPVEMFPTAKILTEDVVSKNKIKNYTLSYNVDGERRQIIIINKSIFELTPYSFKEIFNGNSKKVASDMSILDRLLSYQKLKRTAVNYSITIFDTEYYDGIYYIVDSYCCRSEVIDSLSYDERLKRAKDFITSSDLQYVRDHTLITPLITGCKCWNDFLSLIESSKAIAYEGKTLPTDGVMCRLTTSTFLNAICFKSKDKRRCTVDFKIMYLTTKRLFYVYVRGGINNVIKSISISNKYSVEHFGYSLVSRSGQASDKYILFISPYLDTFEFVPRLNWNTRGYSSKDVKTINSLITDICTRPLKYNGAVVAMSLADDGWVPVKVRKDGEPSMYVDAMNVMSLLYNKFSEDIVVNSSRSHNVLSRYSTIYESVYKLLDQYVIEKYFNGSKFDTIVDLYDPLSVNVSNLYAVGNVNTFYAINKSRSSLIKYVNASMNHEINNFIFMHQTKLIYDRLMDVNIINDEFTLSHDGIFSELIKKYGYKMNSIDAVYVQNQSDEILSSFVKTILLVRFCEKVLSPNGKIIIKFYDGDIINNMKNNHLKIQVTEPKVKCDTKCEMTMTSLESIAAVFYDGLTESYQWKNRNIPIIAEDERTKIESTTDEVLITVNDEIFDVMFNGSFNDPSFVFYYAAFGRYDDDGQFKSEKLLTRNQTLNLKTIFDIDVELISNPYDHTFDEWYSMFHNVDRAYGSSGYTQGIVMNDGEDVGNLLVEHEELNDNIIEFLKCKRMNSRFNTVIVTRTSLDFIEAVHVMKGVNVYVIYSNVLNEWEKNMLTSHFIDSLMKPNELIIEKYTHPLVEQGSYVERCLINRGFLEFFNDKFNIVDVCQPMTQNEISKYVSTNRSYSQIESVEEFMSSLTVIVLERK